MTTQPAIVTRDLTKRYGDFTAVDKLNLEIQRGEIFGLLGPNGAGKTTTILMLLGLSEPSEGEARVAGLDPTRQPLDVKRVVGYLPDNVGFYASMTGRQNLLYTAQLNGVPKEAAETRVDDLLGIVGLAGAAHQSAGTYSRGMRQRLGIADALVKDPEVLILDEPTVGIDPEGVKDVLDLISKLPKEGVTVLLSSHLLYQVQANCDRMGIFVGGKLIAVGKLQELAESLASKWVAIEVGASAEQRVGEALRGIAGVESAEREGEIWLVIADRDLRYEISKVMSQSQFPIFHLRRRGEELDDIYRRYFERGEANGR